MALYDQIGHGYSITRRADARIVERIAALLALPAASRIADGGAGTGITATPWPMRATTSWLSTVGYDARSSRGASVGERERRVCRGPSARRRQSECDNLHPGLPSHFGPSAGLRETRRATAGGPVLLLTFEPRAVRDFWLDDYFPEISRGDQTLFSPVEEVAAMMREETALRTAIEPFPVPSDLTDWFLAAG
jgi:hypothetical protein